MNLAVWALRRIGDKRFNELLPYVFNLLDARLSNQLQSPTGSGLSIDTAIRSAIWDVMDEKASPDQIAIVKALFDPGQLLRGGSDE